MSMISVRQYQRTNGCSTSCSASSRCASSHWFHDQLWIWRSSPVWQLCSSAEATDSWACCIWATAGVRNVFATTGPKSTALTCTSVQTDVRWWAAGPPLQANCLRLSTLMDYWWRWGLATFILLLCTYRRVYHVRVLQDPSQTICAQL